MHQPTGDNRRTGFDNCIVEVIAFAAPTRGCHFGRTAHNGRDAEDVPYSIAPVAFAANIGAEIGRQGGEWMRHPDGVAAGGEGDLVAAGQPVEGLVRFGNGKVEFGGGFQRRWRAGSFTKGGVNMVAYVSV